MKTIAFVELASQMSGVEYSTLYLAMHLNPQEWVPLVIYPEEGELPARCREANIPVQILPHARFFSTSVRVGGVTIVNPLAWVANGIGVLQSARTLAKFLNQARPALVVPKGLLAQFYGGLAARWAGVPCVWHIQDRVSERAGFLFPFVLGLGARFLARHVIVDAESIARQIRGIVPAAQISVIWNGVDLNEFSPYVDGSAVRAEWKIAPHQTLIGSVARLVAWKGQHILLEAFARVAPNFPDAHLVFVGSALFDNDGYAKHLQTRCAELGLQARVHFAGYRQDIAQVLAALDIFCHAALEKDSTPLAVVSAMAAGKAIVCADVDGTRELFEPGKDGLLVAPGNVAQMAEALACLLSNSNLCLAIGSAARRKAEAALGIDGMVERCEQIFEIVSARDESFYGSR